MEAVQINRGATLILLLYKVAQSMESEGGQGVEGMG